MKSCDENSSSGTHEPVMVTEVLSALSPVSGERYLDATFGAGGYSSAILAAADCQVVAIDCDPAAVARGQQLEPQNEGRFKMLEANFSEMGKVLASAGIRSADGVALDLGISSLQLDDGARGFSFTVDGPLDMRMSRSGVSAADLINTSDEQTLATVISGYGEERHARRIARAIVRARSIRAIERTTELADIVASAVPVGGKRLRIHPATRTFQALRIQINNELDELRKGLVAAERLLAKRGRLVVVAFHSLEDRIVKDFLRRRSGRMPGGSRHRPAPAAPEPSFNLPFRKPQRPSDREVAENSRARSARLRTATRTGAPAWSAEALP